MLKATDLALRTALREIDVVSDLVVASDVAQGLVNAENRGDQGDSIAMEEMKRNVVDLLTRNRRIRGAALYGKDRLVLEYGMMGTIPYQSLTSLYAYREAVAAAGRPVWLGPIENAGLFLEGIEKPMGEKPWALSQIRLMKDFYTLEDIGYLVLHLDASLIDNIFFELFQGEADGVFLLNRDHLVLFGNEKSMVGRQLAIFDGEVAESDWEGSFFTRWNDAPFLASYVRSGTGWILASLTSWERLELTGAWLRTATVALFLPVLALAFFFNFFFMRRFTAFVDLLSRAMHRLRGGDLSVRLAEVKGKEFALLRDDFNSMSERIEELVARIAYEQAVKKDAEFRMLQAQIKPHFLYNTLESINALASMNGQTEIHQITVNLGKLLRLSISHEDFFTVADEIAHVRAYLEIQKIRYNRRFEYTLDCDPRMARRRVIKLILQPVVENALYHGLDSVETGGRIWITGSIEDGTATGVFTVRDNGKGVGAAVLESLAQEAARRSSRTRVSIPQEGADRAAKDEGAPLGHGILSVWERLTIAYGAAYGLRICDNGDGTIVKIRFPIEGGSAP
jgi:two-component system sensor histidine kinase YesM